LFSEDHLRVRAAAGRVQHLNGIELDARRDASDARVVVLGSDHPRHMRAVTIVVVRTEEREDAILTVDRV
jgi:hypothetical protein